MSDTPETIVLRRLPPEHVLRETDYIYSCEKLLKVNESAGVEARKTKKACYCRKQDWPAEYDEPKPSIDPGEGWRLLEKDELVQEGDEYFGRRGWRASHNWGGKQGTEGIEAYRRRIQHEEPTKEPATAQLMYASFDPKVELTAKRQQCQRPAERIEALEKLISDQTREVQA